MVATKLGGLFTARQSRNRGVSLVEVLVVLAVIAILSGISGAALMKWIPHSNLTRAARTVVSMVHFAKEEAIKRNQQVSLNCTQAANMCTLGFVNGTSLRVFDLKNVGSGVALQNSFNTRFTGRGRTTSAGSIVINNNAGNSLTVTVRTSGSIVTN